jgi:uncharacterized LabA/DUF88 family protein
MTRVAVYIDYQNAYMRARAAFGNPRDDPFTFGQINPRRLGLLLARRGEVVDAERRLTRVHAYRGEPDTARSPSAQAAAQRQMGAWRLQSQVEPRTRPYRYRQLGRNRAGWVRWEAREKGIDVLIAIDMVMGAVRDEYEVAVLASADTDLVPALESVLSLGKRVEVAAWRPVRGQGSRLTVTGRNIWCRRLDRGDFEEVRDDTDYTRPVRR